MCHNIETSYDRYFLTLDLSKDLILGIKRFRHRDKKLYPAYQPSGEFRLYKVSEGYLIEDDSLVCDQTILLRLETLTTKYTHCIQHPCGLHVASFRRSLLDYPTIFTNNQVDLLAAFNLEDITFFDGRDVSVKSLLLPNPAAFANSIYINMLEDSWKIIEKLF